MTTKIIPPIQTLGFGLLAFALKMMLPAADFAWLAREILAWLMAFSGLVLLISSAILFKLRHTTVHPLHPEKTTALVINGLYHFSRNPMYLGLVCLLLAWTLYLANATAILVSPLLVLTLNRFNIIPEEQALETLFGRDYTDYKQRVRRWI